MKLLGSLGSKLLRTAAHPATSPIVGGIATPLAMDFAQHSDDKTFGVDTVKAMFSGDMDRKRVTNLVLNAGLGAGSAAAFRAGMSPGAAAGARAAMLGSGATLAGGIFAKDLALNLQDTPRKLNDMLDSSVASKDAIERAANAATAASVSQQAGNEKLRTLMKVLGVGALGLGGIATARYLTKKDQKREGAKIKLRIPGRKGDPNSGAEVELPLNMPRLSPSLVTGFSRGVRSQVRKNVRDNSFKRDATTGKLIPFEDWIKARKEALAAARGTPPTQEELREIEKSASHAFAEGSGLVSNALGTGTLGAALGNYFAGHLGMAPGVGTAAGGLLGAVAPTALGTLAGALAGDRTPAQQIKHDSKPSTALEYLIPGYAAYQRERRVATDQASAPAQQVEDDEDYEDYD